MKIGIIWEKHVQTYLGGPENIKLRIIEENQPVTHAKYLSNAKICAMIPDEREINF